MSEERTVTGPAAESPLQRVRAYLSSHDPALEPIVFDEAMHTSEQAARRLGIGLAQVAKSIVFKSKDGFGLFVAAGDVKVDEKVVKEHLGRKPRIARPPEVLEQTGFEVGAVCPFALKEPIPVFVDASLRRFETVYTAAGVPESLVPIGFDQLVAITQATVVDAAGGPPTED